MTGQGQGKYWFNGYYTLTHKRRIQGSNTGSIRTIAQMNCNASGHLVPPGNEVYSC